MTDNKDADVVMEDKTSEPTIEGSDQLYRLEILATIKQQQQQNGLRHGDYQRYRQYCSRRLRRLRQSVKFTHARHHFKPKAIETRHITDPKFLAIPLINAERSWSYAMQLKNDLTTDTPRKRFHLLKRLKRAAQWSRDLERLCAVKADTRTRVEAEGYAAWMQGSDLLERDAHEEALKKFLHAQAVYGELGKLSGPEVQSMCEERVQQLEQMINFCKYHVNKKSKSGNQDSKQLIDSLRAGVNDQLASKLETLLSETRKQQASALETIQWQGRTVPISNDKLRLAFVEAKELASNLKHVEIKDVKEEEGDAKLQTYQAIFAAYDTALQAIRDDLADIKTQATKADLLALQAYANLKKQKFSSSRNVHLAIGLQRRLKEQDQLGYKGKKVKPDEIVTLYEKAIQNQNDVLEVAKANNDTDLILESTGRSSAYTALRVLYLAESYRRLGRSSESLALYTRAITLATDALTIVKEEALITLLRDACNDAKAAQLCAHATGILESEAPTKEITQSVAKLALDERKTHAVLADNLDSYVATPDALVEFPPPFVATACKPILFDLALNSFTLPDLSARIASLPATKAAAAKPKATPAKTEQKEQKQPQKQTPAKSTQQQQGKQQQAQGKGKQGQGQTQQPEQEQGKGGGWFGRLLGR